MKRVKCKYCEAKVKPKFRASHVSSSHPDQARKAKVTK